MASNPDKFSFLCLVFRGDEDEPGQTLGSVTANVAHFIGDALHAKKAFLFFPNEPTARHKRRGVLPLRSSAGVAAWCLPLSGLREA